MPNFRVDREHLYGFRSFDLREGVLQTSTGQIFYTVGSCVVGVKQFSEVEKKPEAESIKTYTMSDQPLKDYKEEESLQRIFSHHLTAVSCFDLHEEADSRMMASAEMTSENNITIWDPDTFKVKVVIKKLFDRGASKLKFSNNGKFIAISGIADDSTQQLVVLSYSKIETFIKSGRKDDKIEAMAKITDIPVLDIVFDSNDQSVFFLAGHNLYTFKFSSTKEIVMSDWRHIESQLLTCITYKKGKTILTSSINGCIIVWNGTSCADKITAHKGAINCFERVDYYAASFITGGDDAFIRFWSGQIKCLFYIDVKQCASKISQVLQPAVTSISWRMGKDAIGLIVYGTRSGEIYSGYAKIEGESTHHSSEELKLSTEIVDKDSKQLRVSVKPIVVGHSDQMLTGITLSFVAPEMFTIGTHNILMHWDYKDKKLIRCQKIDFPAKLLAISLNNNFLVIGCYNGTVLVINPGTFQLIHSHNSEKKEVSALSFSPSNENIAIGYVNGVIQLLSSPLKFKLSVEFRNTNMNSILCLDFSEDNCILKATFSDLNFKLFDVARKSELADSKKIFDDKEHLNGKWFPNEKWSQWRSPVGWQVQGIWGEYNTPFQVKGVVRNSENDMLVMWDEFGGVKVYTYPCLNPFSPFLRISVASGEIATAIFSSNNEYLFVMGKDDSSIAQYRLIYEDKKNQEKKESYQKDKLSPISQIQQKDLYTKVAKPVTYLSEIASLWPTNVTSSMLSRDYACVNLQVLSGVGLSTDDFKCPIVMVGDDTLIYFCGTSFVRFKQGNGKTTSDKRTYSHFHQKKVTAMDLSKTRRYVASGESVLDKLSQAKIIVHDFEKNEVITELLLHTGESTRFLRFSPNEAILLAISLSEDTYRLTMFDWVNSVSVKSVLCGSNPINDVCFANNEQFATVGNNHMCFWEVDGCRFKVVGGDYSDNVIEQITACAYAFENKYLFTGTVSGRIGLWNKNKLEKISQEYDGTITLMKKHKKHSLFTAVFEGRIHRWGLGTDLIKQAEVFDLKDHYGKQAEYLSINPSTNDIVLISEFGDAIRTGTKNKPEFIFREVTAKITSCCIINTTYQILVTTEDSRLLRYSYFTNELEKAISFSEKNIYYTCVQTYAADKRLIVADNKFVLHMVDSDFSQVEKIKVICEVSTTLNQPGSNIHIIKFSSDEKLMAVASTHPTASVEIYSVNGDSIGRQSVINSNFMGYICALDWNKAKNAEGKIVSSHIFVNSNLCEMGCVLLETNKPVKMQEVKDLEWLTMSCMFSFYGSGLHKGVDGSTDITSICTNKSIPFMIAGTKDGTLFVEKNPCLVNQKRKELKYIHLKAVKQVLLSNNNEILVSRSSDSVFVWRLSQRLERFVSDLGSSRTVNKLGQPVTSLEMDPLSHRSITSIKSTQPDISYDNYVLFLKARKENWAGAPEIRAPVEDSLPNRALKYKKQIMIYSTISKRSKPDIEIKYQCSYGVETSEFKPTIYLFPNNEDLMTFSKSFCSIINIKTMEQKRNDSHLAIMTAVVNHPSNSIIASGDTDSWIHIWDYNSNLQFNKFKAQISGGPIKLTFSDNERHLSGLFLENNNYYLTVFDIHQGVPVTTVCLGMGEIRSIMYKKKLEIVTIGDNHLFLWKLINGNLVGDAINLIKSSSRLQCQTMSKLDMVIGTRDGFIQVLREQLGTEKIFVGIDGDEKSLENKEGRNRVVLTLCASNLYIFAGIEDGTVCVLNSNYKIIRYVKLSSQKGLKSSILDPQVVSLATNNNFQGFMGLFRSGEIFQCTTSDIRISNQTELKLQLVRQSHFNRVPNKISRITMLRPTKYEHIFISISEDGTIRQWDFLAFEDDKFGNLLIDGPKFDPETKALSMSNDAILTCFDCSSQFFAAIGCKDGSIKVSLYYLDY